MKPTARSGAVAELPCDYVTASVGAALAQGYRDDEEFDYSRRQPLPPVHKVLVGMRIGTDSDDVELPPFPTVGSSDSEAFESDHSIHSEIADSVDAVTDEDEPVAAPVTRPSALRNMRLTLREANLTSQGRPPKEVS